MSSGTLDTNSAGATTAEFDVTTESLFTLYVVDKTGAHNNHRVCFQFSPDSGTTWLDSINSILSQGCLIATIATTKVRAKVLEAEDATSTVDVYIIGK